MKTLLEQWAVFFQKIFRSSFSAASLVGSTGASPLKRLALSPSLVHLLIFDAHPGNWPDPLPVPFS